MQELKEAYYQEFNVKKEIKHQIDIKFRKYRDAIEVLLHEDKNEQFPGIPFQLFQKRSTKFKYIVLRIIAAQKNEPQVFNDLIKSYIHMFLNRIFTHSQRIQELMIYDFMFRYYASLKARRKKFINSLMERVNENL